MKTQKKGFCPKSTLIPQFKKIAERFMEYCDSYHEHFKVHRQYVSDKARYYLTGLLMKSPRKNMERIDEYVVGSNYESCQQFISDSPWNYKKLNKKISSDVNKILGGAHSVLCIDESCFSKKGKESVGTKRQWNGRLGKVDNCQVGVYASLSNCKTSSLIDYRLFLPEEWSSDEARCQKAKVPEEDRVFKTKLTLALDMVDAATDNNIQFGWIATDAFYGRDSKLLNNFDDRHLKFVADIPNNHHVYLDDPKPYKPRRKKKIGPKIKQLKARTESIKVSKIFEENLSPNWHKVKVRNTTKGTMSIQAFRKRVYLWDGLEKQARQWWLVFTYDEHSKEKKYFLSNAPISTRLGTLIRKHASRFWIERTFQDGKTSVGMADYQARGWIAWHHHMTMVMMALLFMLKERIINKKQLDLLSCQDIVELLNFYIPRKDVTETEVIKNMLKRHDKRRKSILSAYKKELKE